jgi:NAD+ kinase
MQYSVLHRGDSVSQQLAMTFHRLAHPQRLTADDTAPDVIVSIGGDGTMLHAFHRFQHRLTQSAFVGIHTGHLGFYADWMPEELPTLVDLMAQTPTLAEVIVSYPILAIEVTTPHTKKTLLALNECTLKGTSATLVADVQINDALFERFRGDGICVSTPSGSTAYNKSLNGAVLHPALDAIQVTEIASINNRVFRTIGSPLVLPKHHHCDIVPKRQALTMTLDHMAFSYHDVTHVRFTVAEQKVMFARYRPFPFWNRVREAFVVEPHDL